MSGASTSVTSGGNIAGTAIAMIATGIAGNRRCYSPANPSCR
jgi:hypothetical protein